MTATLQQDAFAAVALSEKEARKKLVQTKRNLERKEVRSRLKLKQKLAQAIKVADQAAADKVQVTKVAIKAQIEQAMAKLSKTMAADQKAAQDKWSIAKELLQNELKSLLN